LADTEVDTRWVIVFIIVFKIIVLVRTVWVIFDTRWIVEWFFVNICLSGLSLNASEHSLEGGEFRVASIWEMSKWVWCYLEQYRTFVVWKSWSLSTSATISYGWHAGRQVGRRNSVNLEIFNIIYRWNIWIYLAFDKVTVLL